MLRHIFRLLPHSSQASNKFSPIFRQRTIVALRPSLYVCLGVSVVTFATIITIHGDATQAPPDKTVQTIKVDNSVYIPRISFNNYLVPQQKPLSPTTDETFDLSSQSSIPEEKAVGFSRIDTILLARYVHEQCPFYFVPSLFQPIATSPAKMSSIISQLNSLAHSTTLCLGFTMDITETR